MEIKKDLQNFQEKNRKDHELVFIKATKRISRQSNLLSFKFHLQFILYRKHIKENYYM